jgi:hypothetical protein
MKYILMDYVNEAGWPRLTREEKEHWLGTYRAYMEAMTKAGVLKDSRGLQQTSAATTVRVVNDKTQVLDGPYADSNEQRGGFQVADLNAAIAWAARSSTALHGVVEVRPSGRARPCRLDPPRLTAPHNVPSFATVNFPLNSRSPN